MKQRSFLPTAFLLCGSIVLGCEGEPPQAEINQSLVFGDHNVYQVSDVMIQSGDGERPR